MRLPALSRALQFGVRAAFERRVDREQEIRVRAPALGRHSGRGHRLAARAAHGIAFGGVPGAEHREAPVMDRLLDAEVLRGRERRVSVHAGGSGHRVTLLYRVTGASCKHFAQCGGDLLRSQS